MRLPCFPSPDRDARRFDHRQPGGSAAERRRWPGKHFPLRDQRPQVNDALVAIVEGDLQHAMDDRLRIDDAGQLLHSMGSTFSCAIAAAKRSSSNHWRDAAHARTLPRFAAGNDPCGYRQGDNIDHGAMLCNRRVKMRGRVRSCAIAGSEV
jgi:hypothetical protein